MKTYTNKELKRGGIYSITNKVTSEVYFGDTKNLYERINAHRSTYNRKIHSNPKMRYLNQGGCDLEVKILHFEEDPIVRRDLEKAYILMTSTVYNQTPSLVQFITAVNTIKNKIKYAQTKVEVHTPISLCYKTK